ncbi:MAG: M48 family metalloprotease [Pyrinomonadaceae bacterium]
MYKHAPRALVALCAAFCLVFGAPLASFAKMRRTAPPAVQKKDDKKDDKKEEKKDEKPKLSKQERKYQEIKKFSLELYNKDPEFRDDVEDAYRAKMREHSEYAYDLNTRDYGDTQVMRNGDRLKIYDTLYDNPLAQDYVNRVGQSIVPTNSQRLYAFKILLNPVPEARSLSTGTVYISTGLLSQVDNEAQLAYVLGHEVGHIEKDHWHDDVLVAQGIDPYNEKQAKKRAFLGAMIGAATAGIAGASGSSGQTALQLGALAFSLAPSLLKLAYSDAINSWDRVQEDEADQLGLQYMLERNYDVREVPKFYASLERTTRRDKRVGLGFMADTDRIAERIVQVNTLLTGGLGGFGNRALIVGAADLAAQRIEASNRYDPVTSATEPGKALDPQRDAAQRAAAANKTINTKLAQEIRAKLDAGELIGSTAEFESVMAELKRDNGIRAYYYDMFQMARSNLEESLQIRSNDPYAHFYYGKVLKLTAHRPAEKVRALAEFARAIELDKRRVLPEARLHRALALADNKDGAQMGEIVASLKEYVSLYQREHGGGLPPNMSVIYDYMQEAGELNWSAPPAMNVSTKNIEPVNVAGSGGAASAPAPVPVSAPTRRP